jgi:hypothetical protein
LTIGLIACENNHRHFGEIQIHLVNNLSEDFSFKNNWSYSEEIFKNEFGQLSCDGMCPPEIENMKDSQGRIIADSLKAFYHLIDTSHFFHSINSETNAYEWAGTNFISVKRIHQDTVVCATQNNAATHSSLNLIIIGGNSVTASIVLESVNPTSGGIVYECSGGEIFIDKSLWKKNTLKATFNFNFKNEKYPNELLYWKGKIYSQIFNSLKQ